MELLNDNNNATKDLFLQIDYVSDQDSDSSWNSTQLQIKETVQDRSAIAGDYMPYSMRPETYVIPVVFAIIFVVGLIGNGSLIAIFVKYRSMRNVPNMFICSLAVGDILVVLFCIPFTSTVYIVESWPFGVNICKFSEFIKDLSTGVSVFTLTAMSVDRYLAIVNPMRSLFRERISAITSFSILGLWIAAILFALPSLLFSFVWTIRVGTNNQTIDICYPFPDELTDSFDYPKVAVMFKLLVYYAIPLTCISSCYILIAHHLHQSTQNIVCENQDELSGRFLARKRVAKRVLLFAILFAVCFLPSHVFLIWFYYYPEAEEHYNYYWHLVRMIGFCLSFMNSCLNPVTLYITSSTFRNHFNGISFCCCGQK